MYPVNQVFLGGDPLLGPSNSINSIEDQIKFLEKQKQLLEANQKQVTNNETLIWNEIDSEIEPLTNEQKLKLFNNPEYLDINTKLQNIVQTQLLNLVKSKIENSKEGKELLERQLQLTKKLKEEIIASTNKEMELFKKFKEFSQNNPNVTYDEFIKSNM